VETCPLELPAQELRCGGEARRALDAVEPRDLADGLERGLPVDLNVDRRGDAIGPEGYGAVLSRDDGGAPEGERRRDAEDSLYDESTLNGTTAPVFSQTIAILPPWSVTSTNAIVNWSTENAGLAMFIGTRTTSNFGS
jgi:hypothetical protein